MPRPQWRVFVLWTGIVLTVLLAGAFLFAWSGLYNVAASRGHLAVTRMVLEFGMRNSVETYSMGVSVPANLESDDLIRLGAAHFDSVCVRCHSAPGRTNSVTLEHMLPHPPELGPEIAKWSDAELFWIVKHGLKYTGMPAWPFQSRDDEVWAMVAFLKRLPKLDAESYAALALGNARGAAPLSLASDAGKAAAEMVRAGGDNWNPLACARCHGDDRHPPTSALVPILAGQKPAYLRTALEAFADGSRPSGVMSEIAAQLSAGEMDALAKYYAGLDRSDALTTAPSGLLVAATDGRTLAAQGAKRDAIPPCSSCHDEAGRTEWPRLAGQSRAYIEGQLRLWKSGHRRATADGRLMGKIAERMSDEQIESVAAHYAGLPREQAKGGTQ